MATKIKYLKDENGEVFSPIVDAESVIIRDGTTLEENVYPIIHLNRKLKVSANTWTDVGISADQIKFQGVYLDESNKALSVYGAYVLLMTVNASSGTDGNGSYAGSAGFWQEVATGIMAYSSQSTNSSNTDEIPLSWVGHARNDNSIKLRWARVSGGGNAKLQIYSTRTWDKDCNLNFYFRKII